MYGKFKKKWDKIPISVKVSVSYAVCSIFQKCLSFLTLPLFTRLLTIEQYGQYTIYQSWSGILSIFTTLNLAYGSFSPAMIKFEDNRDKYISSIQGICLLLSCAFLLLYLPLQQYWNSLFELPTGIIFVLLTEIITHTAGLCWSGKKRFEFKYKSVIFVTLMISILSPLVAYFLVINTEEKGYSRIIGYASVNIIIGGVIFFLNIFKGRNLFNKEYWKYAFSFNIPLLAYYLSQMIFNQSDRIMISHICGIEDAALYGVAYNLSMILTFVLNAINNSYVPWLYGKLKVGEGKDNKSISSGIAILLSLLILFVIWYAPEIITIMAGEEYSGAVWVVAPVSLSLILLFYSQLFINVEFYYEEKKYLVAASILAAVVNIFLNALFIPLFGFVVAGYTTLISYILFVFCNYIAMKKILSNRGIDDTLYDYKKLIIIVIGMIMLSVLGIFLYSYLLLRIIITIIVFICIIFKIPKLIVLLKEIK